MAHVAGIGQFLIAEDLSQAACLASLCDKTLSEHDTVMIGKILECNWEDEEQMVSNLLQYPFLIPESLREDCLIKAFSDLDHPYYILSAAVGIQRLQLDEKGIKPFFSHLRRALFSEHGVICARSFITLQPYLCHPKHQDIFVDILKVKKSPLLDAAIAWLVLRVADSKELNMLLEEGEVDSIIVKSAVAKMQEHCDSLSHGDPSPVSVEVFDYIPNLNDFDTMLDKEDTLCEFFEDLDLDHDNKLSAEEVKGFLDDIGKEISVEDVLGEMREIGVDENNRIDKDGFIELMFPKFQMR